MGDPAFLQQAYDLSALSSTAGQGQTVAIFTVGSDATLESELATYRSTYGLSPCTTANACLSFIDPSSATLSPIDEGWATEADLDTQAISAICPNCRIMVVEDPDSDLTQDAQAAQAAGATVFSISATWDTTHMPDPGTIMPTVESSGDDGQDQYTESPIDYDDVTGAGGTTLAQDLLVPRGFIEDAWSNAGSGCLDGTVPSFQQNVTTGCAGRAYSDVSADADPETGLDTYTSSGWEMVGGTSLSAPIIASYYALLQSQGLNDFSTPAWAYAADALNSVPQEFPANGISYYNSNSSTESYWLDFSSSASSYCSSNPTSPLCTTTNGGWSGQAGEGSISGDLIPGTPGIGSDGYVSGDDAQGITVDGGVYSNGEPTQVYLQYGLGTSYGYVTDPITVAAGEGASSVSFTIPPLFHGLDLHYRLVAVNSDGTSYGYDQPYAPGQMPGSAR